MGPMRVKCASVGLRYTIVYPHLLNTRDKGDRSLTSYQQLPLPMMRKQEINIIIHTGEAKSMTLVTFNLVILREQNVPQECLLSLKHCSEFLPV